LARRGKLTPEHIRRLAVVLNRFYESLPPIELPPGTYANRCRQHVQGNLRELISVGHHLPHLEVERVHGFQLQLLGLVPELFEERAAGGRVVDGHGDLRPEHICLAEKVAIFDCIEFSAEFRQIDVADELAFLASECDFLGVEWVGPQLREAYGRHSGDRPPDELWAYYKAYRACVRAKIAALRADQLQGDAQIAAVREAERHLMLADSYAKPWLRPLVLAVGGLSGTGKTTLAKALAAAFGAELLRTDVIRRELLGDGPQPAQADAGVYSPQSRERVYAEMFRRAKSLHGEGISVVLDGTFAEHAQLNAARSIGSQSGHLPFAIECVCRPETARERIARRLAAGRDASDATPALRDLQSQRWQPWTADIPQVRIDTEQPLERQLEAVVAALRKRP
jgi:predicted kinase